jgi:glutaredoxin
VGGIFLKQLTLLYGDNCGYCKKAKMLLKRALDTHPKFHRVDIQYIINESEQAKLYRNELIPAFFCGSTLFFEGNPNMDIVMAALNDCYSGDGQTYQ